MKRDKIFCFFTVSGVNQLPEIAFIDYTFGMFVIGYIKHKSTIL